MTRPSSSAGGAALAAALLVLALLAAAQPVAATGVTEFSDGVCVARINSKGVAVLVDPRCRNKTNTDPDFDLPDSAARTAAASAAAAVVPLGLTVTLAEGDPASPRGAYYLVSWAGVTAARKSDRIAVLIGKQPQNKLDWTLHPRSYFFVTDVAPTTWFLGSGSVKVYLPLLREPVTIAYVRRDTSLLNVNNNIWRFFKSVVQTYIDPPASDPPHNIHLSIWPMSASITAVRVAALWQQRTAITGAGAQWRLSTGEYGGAGSGSASATARTYTRSQMCQEPARKAGWISPSQIYRANITGLAPNTRYAYRVGSDAAGWSEERSFLTPPAANDPAATTRVLITADSGMYSPDFARVPNGNAFATDLILNGDSTTPGTNDYTLVQAVLQSVGLGPGQQPGSRAVVDRMEATIADKHLVINAGDLSYARGEGHQWDLWGAQFGDQVAAKAITAYSPGNHEAGGPGYADSPYNGLLNIDAGGECNVPTRRLLQMAQPSGATSDWYSSDVGPMHLILLNSEQFLRAGSRQRTWLEADLKKVDRSKTPWLVVGLHRPVIVDSNDAGDQKVSAAISRHIEPLLVKYQADLVIAGHIHSGQRSCIGVIKGTCVGVDASGHARGPTYLLVGQGGYQSPLGMLKDVPSWEAWASWAYGFAEAAVTRTTFTVNSIAAEDGTTLDTFALTKPEGWKPNSAAADALYASTTSWVVPGEADTVDAARLTAALSAMVLTAARQSSSWRDRYLQSGSDFFKILNGLPGKDGIDFTIKQVWSVAAPVYELVNSRPFGFLTPALTQDVKFMSKLVSAGGRGYFGQ